MGLIIRSYFLLVLLPVIASAEPFYLWDDSSGLHTVEAQFQYSTNGQVGLLKRNGNAIALPQSTLSKPSSELARILSLMKGRGDQDRLRVLTAEDAQLVLDAMVTPGRTDQWGSFKSIYRKASRTRGMTQPLTEIFSDSWKKDYFYGYLNVFCFIFALISIFWFVAAAFRESMLWGLLCLIPFTAIFVAIPFLILHWGKAKAPFFMLLILAAVNVGGLVLAPSWALEAGALELQILVERTFSRF